MGILGNISSKSSHERLNTIVGEGSEFNGEMSIVGSVRIDGKLTGKLSATGHLTIGSKGHVESPTIHCPSAHIAGVILGDIIAPQRVHLTGNARVDGSITTQTLVIEEGALFNGKSDMTGIGFIQDENISG